MTGLPVPASAVPVVVEKTGSCSSSRRKAGLVFVGACVVKPERRKWPRLELRLSVQFDSPAPRREAHGVGSTENVSAGGIYFLTSSWDQLEEGMKLQLQLSGLSQYNAGPIFRSLEGEGTVLRLETPAEEGQEYSKAGVAVRFDRKPRIQLYRRSA